MTKMFLIEIIRGDLKGSVNNWWIFLVGLYKKTYLIPKNKKPCRHHCLKNVLKLDP